MEHTEYIINAIAFGNYCLDQWLKNETEFVESMKKSEPLRFCMTQSVYLVLFRLGEVAAWWKGVYDGEESIKDAIKTVTELWPEGNEVQQNSLAKCFLVLSTMAEKRLSVTVGV